MSTIPLWAHRGAKVVCIGDQGSWRGLDGVTASATPPVKGSEYTIVEADEFEGLVYLTLAECAPLECYSIRNFRPITKRTAEQDIAEHFADLLKVGAPEGVAA